MPMFYFDLTRGASVSTDHAGFDLTDDAAMRAKAEAIAAAMTRDGRGDGVAVQVRDDHDRIVHASVIFGDR